MYVEPYELKMQEVTASGRPCVLIDDSGTPGQQAGSPHLHPDRKTWVAVITTPRQTREVCEQMPGALHGLKLRTRAAEFHFTEIYRGAGAFKHTPIKLRLALFAFMRHIFTTYMFPVIVQTLSPTNLNEVRHRASFPDKVGPFDMTQPTDMALLFLLFRVKGYLCEQRAEFPCPAYVALDEGFYPAGRSITLPNQDHVFHRSRLFTVRSCEFLPVQLADFASFCVSRTQWLMAKQKRSRADNAFLRIIADLRINVVNLPETYADLATWAPRNYDRMMDEDRKEKGLEA